MVIWEQLMTTVTLYSQGFVHHSSNTIYYKQKEEDSHNCQVYWDKILCWPQTPLNQAVELPCPTYVYKFNRKSNF